MRLSLPLHTVGGELVETNSKSAESSTSWSILLSKRCSRGRLRATATRCRRSTWTSRFSWWGSHSALTASTVPPVPLANRR